MNESLWLRVFCRSIGQAWVLRVTTAVSSLSTELREQKVDYQLQKTSGVPLLEERGERCCQAETININYIQYTVLEAHLNRLLAIFPCASFHFWAIASTIPPHVFLSKYYVLHGNVQFKCAFFFNLFLNTWSNEFLPLSLFLQYFDHLLWHPLKSVQCYNTWICVLSP